MSHYYCGQSKIMKHDVIIIGGGIVGLATAYKLLISNPDLKVIILEKEKELAMHQTGHNSGVLHSGIYYTPGSLKALNCKKGYDEMIAFADKYDIDYKLIGKLIVATKKSELPFLNKIYKNGIENGLIGLKKLSKEATVAYEPHVNCIESIYVPQAGIIDYKQVAMKMGEAIKKMGGQILLNNKVLDINELDDKIEVKTQNEKYHGNLLISCAGLYADVITKKTFPDFKVKIVPFRGEYYKLSEEKQKLVNHLIYPVPDPEFPFLGVHYTPMIDGSVEAGPNAVLAFKREVYSRWNIHFGELFETLGFSGFRKIAKKYWKTGMGEMKRSFSKRAYVKALQHLIPEIGVNDLSRGGAGVRAQALDPDGNLINDFMILEKDRVINVVNAPSPAATASLAIGETIAEKAIKQLGLNPIC